jgi:hypothetical protein
MRYDSLKSNTKLVKSNFGWHDNSGYRIIFSTDGVDYQV